MSKMSNSPNKSASLFSSISSFISDASSFFTDADTVIDNEQASPILFSPASNPTIAVTQPVTPRPNLTSTPIPSQELPTTQELAVRLCDLRGDEVGRAGAKAATPKLLPRGPLPFSNDDHSPSDKVYDNPRVNEVTLLRREIDDLKSELAALRLQCDLNEEERKTLAKENDELQQKLSLALMPTANQGTDGVTSIPASNQEPGIVDGDSSAAVQIAAVAADPTASGFSIAQSKHKKKKQKKLGNAAAAAAAAADTNTAVEPVTENAGTPANGETLTRIHVFHDSNTQTTPAELKTYYANIVKNNDKTNNTQFILHKDTHIWGHPFLKHCPSTTLVF